MTNQEALQAQLGTGRGWRQPAVQPGGAMTGQSVPGGMPAPAPGQVMYGNQPSVPQATGGTMSMQTDLSKLGGERYTTSSQPPGAVGAKSPAAAAGPSYAMEGFDAGKLGNAEHTSPKYQIARALQGFDPQAGVTPEVLAALNALNIGTFTGDRDKIQVGGNVDPRFEGFTNIDLVRGFNGPGGGQAWQYGAENPNAAQAPAAAAAGGGVGGGGGGVDPAAGLSSLLSGNPMQRIQQAIGSINGQGQVNLEALLAQLGVLNNG